MGRIQPLLIKIRKREVFSCPSKEVWGYCGDGLPPGHENLERTERERVICT